MTDEVFTIGTHRGLCLDLDLLLGALDTCSATSLPPEELELATLQLRATLSASAALAPARQLRRRIGEGRYLAVGSLGRLGLSVVLGPVLHLVAAGSALSSARRLLKFDRDWRPRVLVTYAQLEGLDREVFETIHEAQNEWIIVNYDALATRQYSHAFGQVAPTAAEVAGRLAAHAGDAAVRDSLADLVYRGILDSDGTRYWIRF